MDLLPEEVKCKSYINADLIAKGLAPFAPESVAIQAGKLMLGEIDKCVNAGMSFAFETTLSGLAYRKKIVEWQRQGYVIVLYYFSLPTVDMAIERVRSRVAQGGHNIPEKDIRRRFDRSLINFEDKYKQLVDFWVFFDTSQGELIQLRSSLDVN